MTEKVPHFDFQASWITIFFNLFIKLLITFLHKNLNPKFHWFWLIDSATILFTFYQSNGENSEFEIRNYFFMKICDETYMHLHMKWWFLIFSFHSLTTLCGSATTIAKPQRANNVKIVNFMTFYVMKLITALSLTFDWTVGETCIAFLKLFWEHLLIKKRTFWPYACFKTTHHIVQTGLEFHVWHYPLFLFHFLFKRGL